MLPCFVQHTDDSTYRTKQIAHGTLRLPDGCLCLHVRAGSFSTYTTRHPHRRMTTQTVERSRLPYKSRQSCAETLTGFRPRGPSIHNQGNRRPEPARVRLIVVVVVEAPIRVHVPRVVRIVLGGAWLFVVKDESWDKQETQPS